MTKDIEKELRKWVEDNYNPVTCSWTAERSEGHSQDCFSDGEECATSWAAYAVGRILGMKLEEPEIPDEDYEYI